MSSPSLPVEAAGLSCGWTRDGKVVGKALRPSFVCVVSMKVESGVSLGYDALSASVPSPSLCLSD